MSDDTSSPTTNPAEGAGTEPSAPESAPDSSVDHAAENADLRAMLKHYAGADINIDDLMSNNFNRAGAFIPPEPKPQPKQETKTEEPKPAPRRVFTSSGKADKQAKPNIKNTVTLNTASGNVNTVEAHKIAAELSALTPAERAAMLANVKVTP